ncbi:MAG: T9SS type A sorting domain-containing protein [Ignavibacteriales bacterium]|nr:T9SS type A sorting domain-containing protein [Ignavibacteriales bacterium]
MFKKLQVSLFSLVITGLLVAAFINANENPGAVTMDDYIKYKIEKKKHAKPNNGFPDEAMKWYMDQRKSATGNIPENWREEAMQHIARFNTPEAGLDNPEALTWTEKGPGNIGGRVRTIVVHPANPSILYFGAVSGGVWKSTNGGTSWTPLNDLMENLAVCALVMDPSNSNILYAGTGEGFFNADAVRGAGIFKTTDAGASWTKLSSTATTDFQYVNKLVIDDLTGNLWAATRGGLFRSTNGGTAFTEIVTTSNCMDLEIAGTNFSDNQCGVFVKSTNGGTNWSNITIPGPAFSGATTYTSGQAWYNNIVAVDPGNANIIYAAGLDAWKTTNGGTSWTQISNWYSQGGAPPFMHADIHAIAFHPTTPSTFFVGNDGGVYKSTNSGSSWVSLNNNLGITQFYYGTIHPTLDKYYGGTQDNGTLALSSGVNWVEIIGGDGGATEINYNNPSLMFGEYVNFCFLKSTDGGATFNKSMNGIPIGPDFWDGTTDRTLFISPFTMDPNDPAILIGGTYRVWRTTNSATNWTAISGDLTGDGTGGNGATISAVTIAKGNSSVIYVGTSNGRVQVTTNTGSSWTLRNSGLPAAYVTKVAIDPTNSNIAYATFSGFAAGQKVYKTTNAGSNWTNISSNLPNIPVNSFAINPSSTSTLYAGTDLGVFSTTDGGSSWVRDGSTLPNVVVSDLRIRASDNKLVAFTHGRGTWVSTIGGGGGAQITELTYENGIPVNGYTWANNGQGSANRMTAPGSNLKLVEISFYITSVSAGTGTFKPIVRTSSNGAPGTDLVNYNPVTASSTPGWSAWNTSAQNIMVSNDFFIGMIFDGVNKPNFGYNTTNNGRAWDYNGSSWSAWAETYLMRAKVQSTTAIIEFDNTVPTAFELFQNYPNPFNPTTSIRFSLPEAGEVVMIVYDISGKKIAEIASGYHQAGRYTYEWNGKNDFGSGVASGVYLCTIKAGGKMQTVKMILNK